MKEHNWVFDKYIFGVALNGWFAAKYTSGNYIKICSEHDQHAGSERIFSTVADYDNFIEAVTDENDHFYNTSKALNDLLEAL